MRKLIVIFVSLVIVIIGIISFNTVIAGSSGDEHYNDNSYEHANGEQPEPDTIPGMNRAEDRTRNKDS
jgi:hypothetical protein